MAEFLPCNKYQLMAMLAVAVLEWWLGRTRLVRAGSVLEIIFISLMAVFIWVLSKWRKDGIN